MAERPNAWASECLGDRVDEAIVDEAIACEWASRQLKRARSGLTLLRFHPREAGANVWSSGVAGDPGAIQDVTVLEAWSRLERDPACVLIDVRTQSELAFVGVPDLSGLGKQPLFMEWSTFPSNRVHEDFAERLDSALGAAGAGKDTELLFLCRSGGRSLMAARTMAARGYSRCRNVAHGFEGSLDSSRHRSKIDGWKARGLPWVQG